MNEKGNGRVGLRGRWGRKEDGGCGEGGLKGEGIQGGKEGEEREMPEGGVGGEGGEDEWRG